jgi:hypothetical protein
MCDYVKQSKLKVEMAEAFAILTMARQTRLMI